MTPHPIETPWLAEDLAHLAALHELDVARIRADGTRADWAPIWVVVADGDVFVRTWLRRDTGWYGGAVRSGRLWLRSPVERLVAVTPTGDADAARVDAAYRAKCGASGSASMTTPEAAASTLRLTPLAAGLTEPGS